MKNNYSGLIFTNHALERLRERGVSQEQAWETYRFAGVVRPGKQAGTTEYVRRFGEYRVTIIAKQNERGEWIVLSCWMDPPLPGTADAKQKQAYRDYQKASFWKKMFLTFKKQIGL